jgi:hypothetical protein
VPMAVADNLKASGLVLAKSPIMPLVCVAPEEFGHAIAISAKPDLDGLPGRDWKVKKRTEFEDRVAAGGPAVEHTSGHVHVDELTVGRPVEQVSRAIEGPPGQHSRLIIRNSRSRRKKKKTDKHRTPSCCFDHQNRLCVNFETVARKPVDQASSYLRQSVARIAKLR